LKITNRILLALGCVVLMALSWVIVLRAETDADKQAALLETARDYLADEVYILALPFLEEAVGYETEETLTAENMLKETYINLFETSRTQDRYEALLATQMARESCSPDVFVEAAEYYLDDNEIPAMYAVLKDGIAKTGDERLTEMYKEWRYRYDTGRNVYGEVTEVLGSTIKVRNNRGLWGIAGSGGGIIIRCQYEKISTFYNDRAVVIKDGEIYAVDSSNNRLALLKEEGATDFGNYSEGRIGILTPEGWKQATSNLVVSGTAFEELGTFSNGHAAVKYQGKWGLLSSGSEWLIPNEYDGIIMDSLGRSYAQNAAFVKKGSSVYLFANGVLHDEAYDDAKPFRSSGYAAVKKNGKWGFINAQGDAVIGYLYDEAESFVGELAPVKLGELWGYINRQEEIAIEPAFFQAKAFVSGSAPVLTEEGWQFITLLDY
jgi:hypothetical protein